MRGKTSVSAKSKAHSRQLRQKLLTPMQTRNITESADQLLRPARTLHSLTLIERTQARIVFRKDALLAGDRVGFVMQHGLLGQTWLYLQLGEVMDSQRTGQIRDRPGAGARALWQHLRCHYGCRRCRRCQAPATPEQPQRSERPRLRRSCRAARFPGNARLVLISATSRDHPVRNILASLKTRSHAQDA